VGTVRVLGVLMVGLLVLMVTVTGRAPAVADPGPGEPLDACVMADKRLNELSGLVADADHWYAMNDGGSKVNVYVLTKKCTVERVIGNPMDPYDPEDLARTSDGTFWLSDTGDNDAKRTTVALIALTPAGKATLYRLTYPDGPHDTEALLFDRARVPYLITKNPLGTADIYRPAAALASPGPTPLEHAGSIRLSPTGTPGGPVPAGVGSVLVTGAASTADGSVVAVRTYTDAYLFPVPDGNLLAALGKEPVRISLPNEKQGEAIAFEPDGTLVSASEGVGQPIRLVPGAAEFVAPKPAPAAGKGESGSGGESAAPASHKDGLPTLPAIGFTVVIIGLAVLFLRRRQAR
jgi:hypothetical protein